MFSIGEHITQTSHNIDCALGPLCYIFFFWVFIDNIFWVFIDNTYAYVYTYAYACYICI
jgi:hypothetical protein